MQTDILSYHRNSDALIRFDEHVHRKRTCWLWPDSCQLLYFKLVHTQEGHGCMPGSHLQYIIDSNQHDWPDFDSLRRASAPHNCFCTSCQRFNSLFRLYWKHHEIKSQFKRSAYSKGTLPSVEGRFFTLEWHVRKRFFVVFM